MYSHTIPGVGTYRVVSGHLVIDSEQTGRMIEITRPIRGTSGRVRATVTVGSAEEFQTEVAAAERRAGR